MLAIIRQVFLLAAFLMFSRMSMASPCTARVQGKRSTPRGRDAWWCLNQILQHRKHEKSDATWVQGSCSTSVGASAGTHAGGDAGDVTWFDIFNRVKFGRLIGFNIHARRAIKRLWSAHGHWTLLFSATISGAGQRQNNVWYARFGNGLADGRKALDFLPDSSRIKFIRKETRRHYVKSGGTKGYSQPGAKEKRKVVDRDGGWDFEPIGVCEEGGKQYLFNASPTFYPLAELTTTKPASAPATPAPKPQTEDAMLTASYGPGKEGKHVTWFGQRATVHLVALKLKNAYLVGPGPVWGSTDGANAKTLQKHYGLPQTGIPQKELLEILKAEPKVLA
jgi:hypothetical protein